MIVCLVLVLVVIRSAGINHFKIDAKLLAAPSLTRSNLISNSDLASMSGEILLVSLGEDNAFTTDNISVTETIKLAADEILEKSNFKKMNGHSGPIVIFSSDASVSARMWMFLSQMGIKNLYILTNDKDNESFKNKFRPDTLTRPEL